MASTVSALNHSLFSRTHPPKSMDVALLGETIDENLKELPNLATTTTSGTGLSQNDREQLEDSLVKIQAVVYGEKENHVQGEKLLDWLRKLKTKVNDLNDLVEELSTNANASPQERGCSFLKSNPIKHRLKFINSKIKEVMKGLQQVASELPTATPSEEAMKKETKLANWDPEIETLLLEPAGREKDKKEIIDQLILLRTKTGESDAVPLVTVVTIAGVAGIGKTKLARLICRDEQVKAHFGLPIWVDGVHETVDVESIAKRVTESPPATDGKGYLVVLDDLSIEIGDECLLNLQQTLTGPGLLGGAMLITTRSKLVANKITATIRSHNNIVREKERKEIIDQLILLRTNTGESDAVPLVTVVTIVGIAGIGKTILTRLICQDEQVKAHFGLQFWVDGFSDVESIEKRLSESRTMDGEGYLVVLDDLRSAEIGDKCLSKLQQILTERGRPGGAIIITTRSKLVANKITANIRSNLAGITTFKPHVLQGLDEEDSWSLFRQIRELSPIGIQKDMEWKIVMDCGGVPKWITITAMLLNNRASPLVAEAEVAELKEEFLLELKFIYYDNLPRLQKLCFAYCSLFPRDHLIHAERLIHLWTAEGFPFRIGTSTRSDSNSVEENLRRCFNDFTGRPIFKDVEEDECGVVRRCRMQPLMHDLARFVADQEENVTVDPDGERVHEGVLRASFDFSLYWRGIPASLFEKAEKLRAILSWKTHYSLLPKEMKMSTSTCDKIFKTFKSLRMLDLHELGIKTLPSSIGELKNLRYLDLSLSNVETLPGSITKLSNLHTLKLSRCDLLKELPKNIEDLINLRHLEIEGCWALTHMPRKIHKLSSLQTLSLFVVSKDYHLGGPGELASLNSLRGHLEILQLERLNLNHLEKEKYVKNKKHLQRLTLRWDHEDDKEEKRDEKSLECLEPHSELRVLFLVGYQGGNLSSWLASMQCLVKLSLYDCTSCKFLPQQLDQLPNLRILELQRLDSLEFIAENGDGDKPVFFPSLEELTISDCPKLTSWWKNEETGKDIPFFACISKLRVCYCPKLTCMPLFPGLDEELVLVGSGLKPLQYTIVHAKKGFNPPLSKLKSMQSASVEEGSLSEKWLKYFSSLEKLHIREWKHLESLPKGFDRLSSLQRLTIENCPELDIDFDRTEWEGLKSLRSLTIRENPKLEFLPSSIDRVTSLQELELHSCPELSSLPESIGNLKSLGRLVISECNKLASLPKGLINLKDSLHTLIVLDSALLSPRCQPDTGDDWPQISSIKNKLVRESSQDI